MSVTSDDLEIFVFPAANPTAQENLLKSIENPIRPESTVFTGFEAMSEALHHELERIKNNAGGFYAWGAEPRGHAHSTWRKMARGNYVLQRLAMILTHATSLFGLLHPIASIVSQGGPPE